MLLCGKGKKTTVKNEIFKSNDQFTQHIVDANQTRLDRCARLDVDRYRYGQIGWIGDVCVGGQIGTY